VADAEVVAFVEGELLELDAALALARPVKPARITPPPTAAATSERRTRDLIRITPFVISPTLHHRHLPFGLAPAESPLRGSREGGGGRGEASTSPGRRGG